MSEEVLGKEEQKKSMSFWSIGGWVLLTWFVYETVGIVGYTVKLANFYDEDYSFSEHGIAFNGGRSFGQVMSVKDIEALNPNAGGSSSAEMCPNVTSERGFITIGFAGGMLVCCSMYNENQWMVPFKDKDGYRHYMCGQFPNIDEIKQPLDKVMFNFDKGDS
jgi:hypothetical protein